MTDIFDFCLSETEVKTIDSHERKHRLGPDPDRFF